MNLSTTFDQTRQRIKAELASGYADPRIRQMSTQRFEVTQKTRPDIKQLEGREYTIALRTLELDTALPPTALWLVRHHIEQAQETFDERLRAIATPDEDAAIYGDRRHRLKLIRTAPECLLSRLKPAFSRGDLWDSDGAYEKRYNAWDRDLQEALPAYSSPVKVMFPRYREIFLAHLPTINAWFADLQALFDMKPSPIHAQAMALCRQARAPVSPRGRDMPPK